MAISAFVVLKFLCVATSLVNGVPQYRVVVYPALTIIDAGGYNNIIATMCFGLGNTTGKNYCPLGRVTFYDGEPKVPVLLPLGPETNDTDTTNPRTSNNESSPTTDLHLYIEFRGCLGDTEVQIVADNIELIAGVQGKAVSSPKHAGPIIYNVSVGVQCVGGSTGDQCTEEITSEPVTTPILLMELNLTSSMNISPVCVMPTTSDVTSAQYPAIRVFVIVSSSLIGTIILTTLLFVLTLATVMLIRTCREKSSDKRKNINQDRRFPERRHYENVLLPQPSMERCPQRDYENVALSASVNATDMNNNKEPQPVVRATALETDMCGFSQDSSGSNKDLIEGELRSAGKEDNQNIRNSPSTPSSVCTSETISPYARLDIFPKDDSSSTDLLYCEVSVVVANAGTANCRHGHLDSQGKVTYSEIKPGTTA